MGPEYLTLDFGLLLRPKVSKDKAMGPPSSALQAMQQLRRDKTDLVNNYLNLIADVVRHKDSF
jgi:hypothetical protein